MRDAGLDVPALSQRPQMTGFEWLWEAFMALTTCRPSQGMGGAAPIPWTAIQRYAEVEEFNEHERHMLHEVIRHMDNLLLDYYRNQAKAQQQHAGGRRA